MWLVLMKLNAPKLICFLGALSFLCSIPSNEETGSPFKDVYIFISEGRFPIQGRHGGTRPFRVVGVDAVDGRIQFERFLITLPDLSSITLCPKY
jgi:hypothetical protein